MKRLNHVTHRGRVAVKLADFCFLPFGAQNEKPLRHHLANAVFLPDLKNSRLPVLLHRRER